MFLIKQRQAGAHFLTHESIRSDLDHLDSTQFSRRASFNIPEGNRLSNILLKVRVFTALGTHHLPVVKLRLGVLSCTPALIITRRNYKR